MMNTSTQTTFGLCFFFVCNAMYDCEKNLVILTCTSFLNDTLIYLITSKTCNIALHLGV